MLADGDASPSELAAALAMPSNLLSHHLRVLEDAGIVARHRSQGDRRRTYLRLNPGALEPLSGLPGRTAQRVLFVCTGNSARSHLAAAPWHQASGVPAASAGTHPAEQIDPRSPQRSGTACRCPGCPPRASPTYGKTAPGSHRLRPGPRGTNSAALVYARP